MSCKLSKRQQPQPDLPDNGLDIARLAETYPATYGWVLEWARDEIAAAYNAGYDHGRKQGAGNG